jgi:hypothetical protein
MPVTSSVTSDRTWSRSIGFSRIAESTSDVLSMGGLPGKSRCGRLAAYSRNNPSLSLTLAILGEAKLWSVECDVVHDLGVERGTIDRGCNARIVANTLRIGMPAGENVGQNILEHW